MKVVEFAYLLQNNPLLPRIYKFIDKVESLLKRMTWKVYYFLKGENSAVTDENYSLKLNIITFPPCATGRINWVRESAQYIVVLWREE